MHRLLTFYLDRENLGHPSNGHEICLFVCWNLCNSDLLQQVMIKYTEIRIGWSSKVWLHQGLHYASKGLGFDSHSWSSVEVLANFSFHAASVHPAVMACNGYIGPTWGTNEKEVVIGSRCWKCIEFWDETVKDCVPTPECDCTVCWTHGNIWTINVYIDIYYRVHCDTFMMILEAVFLVCLALSQICTRGIFAVLTFKIIPDVLTKKHSGDINIPGRLPSLPSLLVLKMPNFLTLRGPKCDCSTRPAL